MLLTSRFIMRSPNICLISAKNACIHGGASPDTSWARVALVNNVKPMNTRPIVHSVNTTIGIPAPVPLQIQTKQVSSILCSCYPCSGKLHKKHSNLCSFLQGTNFFSSSQSNIFYTWKCFSLKSYIEASYFQLMTNTATNQKASWRLEGDYFEGCNCDIVCPCIFLADPDEGNCLVTCAWHIRNGNYENIGSR